MDDITQYIKVSGAAINIADNYVSANNFLDIYQIVNNNEKKSLIRHFVINNVPFIFKDQPILYEQLTQYLSDRLKITAMEIKLIGSAKTGFSITPPPTYGKAFGLHSDLDFSIINGNLFDKLKEEFTNWAHLFKSNQILPQNVNEQLYWSQNLANVPNQFKNNFIDTHLIPNRELFINTKKINNSMWLIKNNLDKTYNIKIKKASARIYKDWISFAERLYQNTDRVMKKIEKNDN